MGADLLVRKEKVMMLDVVENGSVKRIMMLCPNGRLSMLDGNRGWWMVAVYSGCLWSWSVAFILKL